MPQEFQSDQQVGHGRYVLEKELGRGGMGVVWLAKDQELGEQVALKFMPPEIRSDPMALDDMRRETLKSRRLTHPNIARIHDFSNVEGEAPFISMEYMAGPNLSQLQVEQPDRVFRWNEVAPWVKQLCEALQYAHEENVVHRDLKPGNLMIDAKGRLKLCDFGLAASVADSLSRVSRDMGSSGTPPYMSPQQLDGRQPTPSDDVYGLGATIYELLTSKPPFYSGDIPHQIRAIEAQSIDERLGELGVVNEVPAEVAALVMSCLSKEPSCRPASAAAVAETAAGLAEVAAEVSESIDSVVEPVIVEDVEVPPATEISDLEYSQPLADLAKRARNKKIAIWAAAILLLLSVAKRANERRAGRGSESGAQAGATPVQELASGDSLTGFSVFQLERSRSGGRTLVETPNVESQTYWTVKDGRVRVSFRGASNFERKTYLVLGDKPLRDFEFAFAFRNADSASVDGDAGVFYRSAPTNGWFFSGMSFHIQGGSGGYWPPDMGAEEERVATPEDLGLFSPDMIKSVSQSSLIDEGGGWGVVLARGDTLHHLFVQNEVRRYHRLKLTEENDGGQIPRRGLIAIEVWINGDGARAFEFDRLLLKKYE